VAQHIVQVTPDSLALGPGRESTHLFLTEQQNGVLPLACPPHQDAGTRHATHKGNGETHAQRRSRIR
jgi:hypothetical protein